MTHKDPTQQDVKCIFQIVDKRNGTRSPAIFCSPVEFCLTAEKVYAIHEDIEGNPLPETDLRPLSQYGVLVIAAMDPDDSSTLDRRGVSQYPLIDLGKFCHMIKYPDKPFVFE